jgi:hypothetical protein
MAATLRECAPDRDRQLHALEWALEQDVPNPATPTPIGLDQRVATRLRRPALLPEGWLVAVDGDAYAGMTVPRASAASPGPETGLTGARREYRRQGIALALNLRASAYVLTPAPP